MNCRSNPHINIPHIPEIDRYIFTFLPNINGVYFAITTKDRYINTKSEIIKREYIHTVSLIKNNLRKTNYHVFAINLSKFKTRFNKDDRYEQQINELLYILFNEIKLPTVWVSSSCGYYDIRYFFELMYYGGKIDRKNIIINYFVYDRYYNYFVKFRNNLITDKRYNKENIINCILDNMNDTTLKILKREFIPEPKNSYNQYFTTPLNV